MQEFFDDGDHPQGDVVDGQLLVTSSQGAALLVPTDHLLDATPPPIGRLVERLLPHLVLARRDHAADVAAAKPVPDPWVTVALVPRDLLGPARSARTPRTLRP